MSPESGLNGARSQQDHFPLLSPPALTSSSLHHDPLVSSRLITLAEPNIHLSCNICVKTVSQPHVIVAGQLSSLPLDSIPMPFKAVDHLPVRLQETYD